MSLIDQINQKLYTKTAKINSVACLSEKRNNTELYQNIILQTSFLPLSVSFAERIYCIKNIMERMHKNVPHISWW